MTEALLKSSFEIILWCLNTLLKESVDMENQDMVSLDEEEDKQIKENTKCRDYTYWNPKKAHPTSEFVIVV